MNSLGPRRLSWGRSSSTSGTSASGGCRQHSDAGPQPASCGDADTQQQVQQACRALLRGVLDKVLLQDDARVDHYQLTLPAVRAVIRHRLAEAAGTGRTEAAAEAAAAAKQLVAAAHREAAQQLERTHAEAAAAAAQHRQEVTGLRAQLASLQRQQKQLQNKAAQQARDLRHAAEAASSAHACQQALHEQLQSLTQQLQGKSAALSRSASIRQQEAASLKAELQQALAAAAAANKQHQEELHVQQQAHAAHVAVMQQRMHDAAAAHHQEAQQHSKAVNAAVAAAVQDVQAEVAELQRHQQQAMGACCTDVADMLQAVRDVRCAVTSRAAHWRQEAADAAALAQLAHHGLTDLAAQARQAASARSEHAMAVKQLQQASLQLATLQPSVQHLQQDRAALLQQVGSLQAQLALAQAGAASQQHHAEQLQQRLDDAQQHAHRLQQQLQQSVSDASALRQEAERRQNVQVRDSAVDAAPTGAEGRQCCLQQLRQVQERLQLLCREYFPACDTHMPSAARAASKLEQLCVALFGDHTNQLLGRYEQYMVHRQEVFPVADPHSRCSLAAHAGPGVAATSTLECGATCATCEGIQRQLLQLEACLLQLMLSLQESLADVQQAQPRTPRAPEGMTLCGSATTSLPTVGSPGRQERPGTASSSSSRQTDATWTSGSSASLSGQLLQAMRREKQVLARELKQARARYLIRVSAGGSSPWRSAVLDNLEQQQQQQQLCPGLAAEGRQQSRDGSSATAWEEVDAVLQLLKGCHLDAAGKSAPPSTAGTSWDQRHIDAAAGAAGASPEASLSGDLLEDAQPAPASAGAAGGAAAGMHNAPSRRCAGRALSWGTSARSANAGARLQRSSSRSSPGHATQQPGRLAKGIGSLLLQAAVHQHAASSAPAQPLRNNKG